MQVSKIAVSNQFFANKNQKAKVQSQQSFGWSINSAVESAKARKLTADAARWSAIQAVKSAPDDIALKVRLQMAEAAHSLAENEYFAALAEAYPMRMAGNR